MGKCTKIRCPMQSGTIDEDCDIKDCPYRTQQDNFAKLFLDSVANYLENTVEITKNVRVPKGDTCDYCFFKKHGNYKPISSKSDCDCICGGGGVYCALYGERLELSEVFRNNSFMCATIPPENWSYCKCKGCLEDTKSESEKSVDISKKS